MRAFRDTPIRQKIVVISLLSSGAALLLACASFLAYELGAYRNATLGKLTSVAGVIAANSSAALSFEDRISAEMTLSALDAEAMVVSACIYGANEELFATYGREGTNAGCHRRRADPSMLDPEGNTLAVALPIVEDAEEIGSIVILAEPIDLYARLARYAGIMGLVMLTSGLASLPLANRLQRFISDPILRLVETSKHVSTDQDFSVRAVRDGEDEVGVLVDSFNDMLEQIEFRDAALARHRENLEGEVERRTAEIQSVNVELKRQITQREKAEERIRYLAYYDGLTGLPNRQMFQERLQHALATAKEKDRPLGLLFLDLDRFKQVNDTLGHSVGDELLCEVSDRVLRCVRFSDYVARADFAEPIGEVARLGGDEFTLLLTEIRDEQDAAKVAGRVLEELAKPFAVGGYELFTTASIGIAVYPVDGGDPETLLRNADTAMYHAKSRHRNNFQFYTEEMNTTSARKLLLASRLRTALQEGLFSLNYQPLRNAASGKVVATEALLRWTDPELGRVGPDEFIPIAEDTGLILSIGEWVLRTACAQARAWQDEGFREIRLAVNVSSHQFRQPDWAQTVSEVLQETGLSPGQLELEMTETAIMQHDDATMSALTQLNDMGVGLALDDFGTGYSSLSYLRRFPIGRVKIDRSFVGDITSDPEDAAITAAILAMAQSLQLSVVAEGVETVEQADFLRERGCDELQGYLFSPPVPPADFTKFLERQKRKRT
ncbi:MAG: EAL domain-containing protein [Myxococcota bacterium]